MINAYLQNNFQHGNFQPLIDRIYPLEEAAQAHTDIIASSGACGRITLKISE